MIKKIITIFILILMVGCTQPIPGQGNLPNTGGVSDKDVMPSTSLDSQELKTFANVDELKEYLSKVETSSRGNNMMYAKSSLQMESVAMMDTGAAKSMPSAGGSNDFSTTNVQYANVDEADFVKNDGKYIYIIADNKLIIVDAENVEKLSEIEISQSTDWRAPQAKDIFLKDNKVLLFVEKNEPTYNFEQYDIMPRQSYRKKTVAQIYDVTDKKSPKLSKEIEVSGSYFQSRMIDDVVYIVAQENTGDLAYINEPMIRSDVIVKPIIHYFDNSEDNYNFNTIASIDLSNEKIIDSKAFLLGYGNTLMVSENNIYIAYQKQNRWYWGRQNYEKERFYDVILPLLKGDLKTEVDVIANKNIEEKEKWEKISVVLNNFFIKAENDDKLKGQYESMLDNIMDALEEYDTKKELEQRKTIIHKIGIDDGKIEYTAKGEIDGQLLNQFSMDENKDYLRVASTVNIWNRKRIQYNNVYVLDDDMEVVGSLTGIAPDEKIYSTRFLGDKLYMVTFKQIDPFFVIDLSDVTNPEIAGELKIPGYSDYLHPYDENHIIGIGKEADYEGKVGGLKIALFDVSDISNPIEIDKMEIGDKGSDSAALHDHHAFLFSKEKNLLILPVTEITQREKINDWRWSNTVWSGSYVFDITEKGFDIKGKIKHGGQTSDYWRWFDQNTVLRNLYIGEKLYSISTNYIKVNSLDNELEETGSLKLPYSEQLRRY